MLLERAGELQALREALDTACRGTGALVLVEAHPGLGKSTLLDQCREIGIHLGMRTLAARGHDLEQALPFGVALQLFEPAVQVRGSARAELFSGAAELAASLFAPRQRRRALQRTNPAPSLIHGLYWLALNVSQASADSGGAGVLLVLVDDAQWSDRASLRFLIYLAQRLEEVPVALVLSLRSGEPAAPDDLLLELKGHPLARILHPSPLTEQAVEQLVRAQLSVHADEAFCRACFEVTRGNPFLLHELLAALRLDGVLPNREAASRIEQLAPGSVLRATLTRLGRLPPPASALARTLAVLGPGTRLRYAATLAGLDQDAAGHAADLLVAAGFIEPGEPLRFVHPLIASAVAGELPVLARERTHRLAARLLATESEPIQRVAAHLASSSPANEPWAAERLREAGREAFMHGSPEAAAHYLSRALAEPPPVTERGEVLFELAQAQASAGDAGATQTFREALELIRVPRRRAEVWLELGRVLYHQGRHAEAAHSFESGQSELGGDGNSVLARDLRASFVGAASMDAALRPRAAELLQDVLRETEGGQTTAERVLLAQLAMHESIFSKAPRDRVIGLAERAWGEGALLAQEGPEGSAWNLVTAALTSMGAYERSKEVATAVLEEARRRGSVIAFGTASYCRGVPEYYHGDINEAIADMQLALDARRHGWEMFTGVCVGMLAKALMERGELAEAEQQLAVADEPRYAESLERVTLLEARGSLRSFQGRYREALADHLACGKLATEVFGVVSLTFAPWRVGAALAALHLGERDQAALLIHDEHQIALEVGAPGTIGRARWIQGLVAGGDEGLELMRQGIRLLASSEDRLEHARALVEFGASLRRAGDRTAGQQALRQGLELAETLGALSLAARAREELAAAGARPRRVILTGVNSLTATELRVARMAGQGLTNREIAQSLFVTVKAVEGHLAHAYGKLGITSRKALAESLGPAVRREPGTQSLRPSSDSSRMSAAFRSSAAAVERSQS